MAGRDKALLTLGGSSLLARAIAQLAPQTRLLVLNTNSQPRQFAEFRLPIVSDRLPGHPGPLAGIHAGLSLYPGDWLLTVAVDVAAIPGDLAQRLRHGLGQAICAYAVDGDQHALAILWRPGSAPTVDDYLNAGQRAVRSFLARHGAAVRFDRPPDRGLFLNINTPDDLARAERELATE